MKGLTTMFKQSVFKPIMTLAALIVALSLSAPSFSAPEDDAARLEPTQADFEKARAQRAKKTQATEEVYVSERGTVIRKNVDQNNHMRSITVTPSETGIPYTMDNQADRPIENGAGANTRSTLGTPKFIEFKW